MDPDITPEALRQAFAGPDFDRAAVRRRYLVIVDGAPQELREPDDRNPEPDERVGPPA